MSQHLPSAALEQKPAAFSTPAREQAKRLQARRAAAGLSARLGLVGIYAFLVVMAVFALFPLYYVVQASFAGAQNLYTTDLHLFPAHFTFANYVTAFTQEPLLNWIGNTLLVCGLTALCGLVCSTSGAYALARFRFAGRELTLRALLTLQAFPGLLALTAYYLLLNALHLLNNLLGLVLIYSAGAIVFCCWNTKSYLDGLPIELEQAALLDGATPFQAFWHIVLPLATPALAVAALFTFMTGWNEFALANLVLNANANGSNLTFILGLYSLQSDFRTPWGIFAASSVIVSIPLMLIFFFAQRYFRSGLAQGGLAN
ncbi:MAG: ABC transporter permease subunit [Thermogemmatispora sp.]|jgi:arabinogalactan oligomer/maltooligosaccharide transport system permease protein|uniref:ABC transporter permease n=1 Tax=Thermogemmatispora aurantia TaxID=2045279 RepID=A0A5J4KAX1_9CHLR|nr:MULTISPECIES: ABC transporter permease subunit [Thermogemmatispora]MBE3568026.1 ABC transporter permease subunit [Thermogemmatispora sp.]GER83811.1 ABC transporter permease [Thermogemmatispora aurantia]